MHLAEHIASDPGDKALKQAPGSHLAVALGSFKGRLKEGRLPRLWRMTFLHQRDRSDALDGKSAGSSHSVDIPSATILGVWYY